MQESLWPTPTTCTETQHSLSTKCSQEVPHELPLLTQECVTHLGDLWDDVFQNVCCDAKGEGGKGAMPRQLAKLQAEAHVSARGSAVAWDLLCLGAAEQVLQKTTAI